MIAYVTISLGCLAMIFSALILFLPLRDAQVLSIPFLQASSSRLDGVQAGRDKDPVPRWSTVSIAEVLAVNLLPANSAKLTYILCCLDGVINTLIPNC